jgi:hypothetical protein
MTNLRRAGGVISAVPSVYGIKRNSKSELVLAKLTARLYVDELVKKTYLIKAFPKGR